MKKLVKNKPDMGPDIIPNIRPARFQKRLDRACRSPRRSSKAEKFLCIGACLCLALLLSACAIHDPVLQDGLRKHRIKIPAPLREPASSGDTGSQSQGFESLPAKPDKGQEKIRFKSTPGVPLTSADKPGLSKPGQTKFPGEPVTVNFDALPLPAFINEVYGNILKTPFEIASSLRNKQDMVTLRAETPLSPSELDALARQVLGNYGVKAEPQGEVLRFIPGRATGFSEPPLLISGRTLPEVPVSHRPVFQLVPLRVVRNVHVAGWLRQAYKGQKLEIFEDPERNAVLLMGAPSVAAQALKAVRLLDQPYMRGRYSVRIEPVFLSAEELAKLLTEVLNSEGYSATLRPPMGSIIILPVPAVNAVLVFAADASVLGHVREWARTLDHPGQKTEPRDGFFYYQVRNTRAAELVKMLDTMLTRPEPAASAGEKKPRPAMSGLLADDVRNGIIFRGKHETWEQLLPLIHDMDHPARMVLIEVIVAEVTLNAQEELGIEWIFKKADIGELGGTIGTLAGMGIGAKGLTYTIDNAGQTRAILNAFAADSRVSILSTPRIMVRSGNNATIDVGTEVPIITSQSTSPDLQQNGSSAILQEIQYRKTGILLNVSPVVHSGNRIDLEITQEVSESKPNTTTNISSPNILTRKISTSLTLEDGGSVLLGGLISSSTNRGYSGVPVLSSIPIIGRLFRVERETEDRTELIMLIIPYIIDSSRDAEAITESFQERLRQLK
ncbi:type II secretion system protein GspD [Desulfococcaceae bacterium HSG8]|nr:type II secretion system protein GspD [Desulfococcaceae bacterium HSG8]